MATRTAETGVQVGIAAITMTFAALSSALLVRQGAAPDWRHFTLPPVLYPNTLFLAASSAALERARRAAPAPAIGHDPRAVRAVQLALGFGLLFLAGQVLAWRALAAQGLFLWTSPGAAFFYVLTVLHALHLLGGIVALAWASARLGAAAGPGTATRTLLAPVALYWHFMGVLWLYLLLLLVARVQ